MVTQSREDPVPLLLTRPAAQGADFAARARARFGSLVTIINTPLLAPRFFTPVLPEGPFCALILTSQTGVDGYVRLKAAPDALPKDAFCVGARTASAARAVGLRPILIAEDAARLIVQIKALGPAGRLLHLRGREARGDIVSLLDSAGIDTKEAVIYAQDPLPLSPKAQAILMKPEPVIVPLFSPRTAAIFNAEMVRISAISPLLVASMSGEIALEASKSGAQIKLAERPNAAAMIETVAQLLNEVLRA